MFEGMMDGYSTGTAMSTGGLAALAVYMGVIQLLRFRRIRWMKKHLDAKKDADEIFEQMALFEFPFMVTKSLEFALFSTYGVPSISKLLQKTGQFRKHVGKRYDQTDLILREYYESGTDSDRSKVATARMNAIHGMYSNEISNADMLFTLSLFVTEPARWIDRFGWRRCTDFEKEALLTHYKDMGERMGIKYVSWESWDDANNLQAAYAEEYFRPAASNTAIASVTVDLFVSLVPKPFQSAARWPVYALIDPPLLKAMGLPQAPTLLQWIVKGSLLLRAMVIRFLLPPRPEFLSTRRTPVSDAAAAANANAADVLLQPNYSPFNDARLGCLFYMNNGYKIGEMGPQACPAGQLFEGLPSYTGKGGGGSERVIHGADGSTPLAVVPPTGASPEKSEAKGLNGGARASKVKKR